ncbi:MAG TPA: cytochrome c peroxidase [Burkholderiaceae bacterium]|nr:cytochrome c peroxidase [Burkholderiaceae bacterium]
MPPAHRAIARLAPLAFAAGCLVGTARADAPVAFTDEEIARIVAHGPWPPPVTHDPSNRVSGDPYAIDLGRRLFFDPRFSPNGYVACVACHQPDRAFTDSLARAHALGPLDRNAQSLANLRLQRWYGWGGTSDSLWMQTLRPILDARELGSSAQAVAHAMRTGDGMACRYQVAFKRPVPANDELVLVDVAKALAAFEETLTTGRTPFDEFRDALAAGDHAAEARYPEAAKRGLRLFEGRGNCFVCHSGPNFTNGEFHDSGVPFFIRPGVIDPGRYDGIRNVRASPFNLLGQYNDDPARATAQATRHVQLEHRNWGEFRTPSLRNVAVTAPYMHDGTFPTLRDVVVHYSELDEDRLHADGERILRRLDLSFSEIDDLVAFLETLTDADGERRRVPAPLALPCD